jgi:hypothetical protein
LKDIAGVQRTQKAYTLNYSPVVLNSVAAAAAEGVKTMAEAVVVVAVAV